MPDVFFLDEQQLLLQAQLSPESDAAIEPDLYLMAEWQANLAGQFRRRKLASGQPLRIAFLGRAGIEIELALAVQVMSPATFIIADCEHKEIFYPLCISNALVECKMLE